MSLSRLSCCAAAFVLIYIDIRCISELYLHASILDTCRSARDAAYKKVFVCFENAVVLVCVCVRVHDVWSGSIVELGTVTFMISVLHVNSFVHVRTQLYVFVL